MDAKNNKARDGKGKRYIKASGSYELHPDMFKEELDAIDSRRRTYGQPSIPSLAEGKNPDKLEPSAERGLVGLAFSGGGIRSSTLNIGLIQGLGESAVIERVDYLSTVSGGGFAGGCLSASLKSAPTPNVNQVKITGLPDGATIQGATLDEGAWLVDPPADDNAEFAVRIDLPGIPLADTCRIQASIQPGGEQISVSLQPQDNVHWHKTNSQGSAWEVEIDEAPETSVTLNIARRPFPFAFRNPPHAPESVALQHLREYADYLKPHRAFSALRIPALFIMGFITNFFVLMPMLLIIAAVTYATWSAGIEHALCTNSSEVILKDSNFNESGYAELQLGRFLVSPETCSQGNAEQLWVNLINVPTQAHQEYPGGGCSKVDDYANSRTQTILNCTQLAASPNDGGASEPAKPDSGQRLVRIGLAAFDDPFRDHLEITVRAWRTPKPPTIFDKDGKSQRAHEFETDPISELIDSTFNYVLGFLWLLVLMMLAYPLWKTPKQWRTRDTITRPVFGLSLILLLIFTAIELQPLGTYYFASAVGAPESGNLLGDLGDMVVFLTISATVIGGMIARSSAAKSIGRTLLMYGVAVLGFLTLWLVAAYLTLWLLDCNHVPGLGRLANTAAGEGLTQFFAWLDQAQPVVHFTNPTQCSLQEPSAELALIYIVLALLLYAITQLRFNINNTSFHHFYRDRLSRAFSFNSWGKNAEHIDNVPLAELATHRGPFHILNTTLNLPSTKIGNLKGRGCDFFVFTPERVGGQLTGYVRTEDYTNAEPGFDLISAMAVSGAAAAPTMGVYTNRALVFLMALLNVRLDFWVHNPHRHTNPPVRVGTVGAHYLLLEMFGALDEDKRYVNLSDGGHLENLGVYELLRRHCKLIICSDCQADEGMMFDGLADLIRLVRIDMGIEITINVDDLKIIRGKNGKKRKPEISKAHFAIGKINYGENETGVFVYIKASLTGTEDLYIENYRSDHLTFPNETTADQFFDERQFEAYRSLGQHIAVNFLESEVATAWLEHDEIDERKLFEEAGLPIDS